MFTEFDVLVSVIVIIATLVSMQRGFVKDFLAIVSWVGAAIATLVLFPYAAGWGWLEELFRDSLLINLLAVLIVFSATLIMLSLISSMIVDNLREFRRGPFDKPLGMLFGLLKGYVIVSLLHFAVTIVSGDREEPEWLEDGETYAFTKSGADVVDGMYIMFEDEARDAAVGVSAPVRRGMDDINDMNENKVNTIKKHHGTMLREDE